MKDLQGLLGGIKVCS